MKIIFVSFILLANSLAFAKPFTVTSKDIKEGATLSNKHVFNGMGCTGENLSPQLAWQNAPQGTKSFAVTVYDPDAPTGSGWWHWTLFNLPANTKELPQGLTSAKLPKGAVEGRTDYAKAGFGGACPPPGDKPHRYIVTVYALKTDKIDLDSNAPGAMVGYFLNQNAIEKATLTGLYGR